MIGVHKKDLRKTGGKGYEACHGLPLDKDERAIHGFGTGASRIAEGYAYVLPTMIAQYSKIIYACHGIAKRLTMLKISSSIYDCGEGA